MTDLHYLSATRALELFRTKDLSPAELLTAVLERAERVEPQVNAFTEQLAEEAIRQALASESRYMRGEHRPLDGLPVAAKEEQPIAGRRSTHGTLLTAPSTAKTTAIGLTRVQLAGGIIHARTTTSEYCCMPAGHTRRWGTTRNPWNPATSPGGSSGGSAASLAAGTSLLATGSDIGGSLRTPASLTGTVAFKPSHGRIPVMPPEGRDTYYHHGPMARTVADVRLLYDVLAGPDPRDPQSRLETVFDVEAAAANLRVAVVPTPGDFPVDPEVRDRTLAVGAALSRTGARVEVVEIGWVLADVKRALWAHFGAGLANSLIELDRERSGVITPYAMEYARRGVEHAAQSSAADERRLTWLMQTQLNHALAGFDAIVMPTMGATAFAAGEDYVERPLLVDGHALEHFSDASLTPVFNICSAHPVVAVPSGWASNGVPTGVQVVAPAYADHAALRIAASVEASLRAGFFTTRQPPIASPPPQQPHAPRPPDA